MQDKLTDSVTPQPWRLCKRVLPQHTDHAGVMWHGAYVGWLEEARVEALAAAGLSYSVMVGMGLEMPVVSMTSSTAGPSVMATKFCWRATVGLSQECAGPGGAVLNSTGRSWLKPGWSL